MGDRGAGMPELVRGAVGVAAVVLALSQGCSTKEAAAPSTGDGGPSSDAGMHESSAADVTPPAPTFCEELDPQPFFCADFDRDADPAAVFRTVSGTGAKVDKGALLVVSDGADVYVEQDAEPEPQWTTVELAFSITVEALASDARIVMARIGQHQTDTECRIELQLEPNGLTLRGAATTTPAPLTKKLVNGTKARVVVTMDATSDAGNVKGTVTVDGQAAIASPLDLGCPRLPGPPRISLGRITGGGAATLRIDDVVFDGR